MVEGPWQRLFLDAGLTFWGEYDEESAFEDFEDVLHEIVDIGAERGLVGERVGVIRAQYDPAAWWLEIAFCSGRRLRLDAVEPSNLDSPIRLRCEGDT